MLEEGIRLRTIGELDPLPSYLKETIEATKKATEHCNAVNMILAINYGARDELCRAIQTVASEVKKGVIQPMTSQREPSPPYLTPRLTGTLNCLFVLAGSLA